MTPRGMARRWLLLWTLLSLPGLTLATAFELGKTGLAPQDLAVIVNEADPISVKTGEYYRDERELPAENLIRVRFPAQSSVLSKAEFMRVKAEVERLTPPRVQAYALAWTRPYRVDCMSITAAFAFGFDAAYCSSACGATRPSPYFNSGSHAPYTDFALRPAMLLAGASFLDVKALIDRGIAADFTYPAGTGYLLETSDKNRSVRAVLFEGAIKLLGDALHLERVQGDAIRGKRDVLFYFTGLASVPGLTSLGFLPGAMADHLTSTGGQLTDSRQMSSLRWLEAGATGSYGTVVEPCNHLPKFPHPAVAMGRYAEGDTLIEAYWKSVAWPGEGVFIGEPLARPFATRIVEQDEEHVVLKVFSPEWKNLRLEEASSPIGPYRSVEPYPIKPGLNKVTVALPSAAAFYRIVP